MKGRKLLVSLLTAVALIALTAVPAMAVEQTQPASVTVSTYISATITDAGDAGINFGSLDPGDTDQLEIAATNTTGAINITVAAETNVACKIGTSGSGDFVYNSYNFPLSNAKWDTDFEVADATAMTTSYVQIGTDTSPGTVRSQEVWHWITIPSGQEAGIYTTDFYYKADVTL